MKNFIKKLYETSAIYSTVTTLRSIKWLNLWGGNLGTTVKIWSLTFIIPLLYTVLIFLSTFLLGTPEEIVNVIPRIIDSWVDFYITGTLLTISAWKIHIVLLFICFVIVIFDGE